MQQLGPSYTEEWEGALYELTETLKAEDWLSEKEKKILECFFAKIHTPHFHSKVIYTKNPTGVIVEQTNEDLVALISYTVNKDDEYIDDKRTPFVDTIAEELQMAVFREINKGLDMDLPQSYRKKEMIAYYRVYERSMYEKRIPLTCGNKDVYFIREQIDRTNKALMADMGVWKTLAIREFLMKENFQDSLTRHYKNQEVMMEHLAENFCGLNWEHYEVVYDEGFRALMLKMFFPSCKLVVSRILDKPIETPIVVSLYVREGEESRSSWLSVPPTEIDEDYFVSHLSEFINGELSDIQHIKFDGWNKERDTPKFLTGDNTPTDEPIPISCHPAIGEYYSRWMAKRIFEKIHNS